MLTVDQRTMTASLERYITNIETAYNTVYAFPYVVLLLTSGCVMSCLRRSTAAHASVVFSQTPSDAV